MPSYAPESVDVVSPCIYALIATSRRLRQQLLPDGLLTSPYEVVAYQATLTLGDAKGSRATFHRRQRIRFLHEGVTAILDHAWGDGVLLTHYHHDAGTLEDSFTDQGRRHLVIGLKRPMHRGEELVFDVVREAMVGFTKGEEWLETTIDHPVQQLRCRIVFPKARPCQSARLESSEETVSLPIQELGGRDRLVDLKVTRPRAHRSYMLRWVW